MLASLTKRFWTLKNKMIVLALMPLMVLTIFLGYSFTQSRLDQIDYSIEINAKSMSNELSYVASYALSKNDNSALHYITYEMLTYPYITGVAVYDNRANPIIALGKYPLLRQSVLRGLATQQDIEHKLYIRETDDTIEVMTPIFTIDYMENQDNISRNSYSASDILGWAVISVNKYQIDQLRSGIVKQSLMLAFIALFMTFLIAIKLANELLQPLMSLIQKVRKIRSGNLDVRFDKSADNEFGVLNEVIENMVINLRDANAQMKLRVDEATEALKQRNQELRIARDKAEKATQVKSQFLANMSHEIRTPLNAVVGFMDLLAQTQLSSAQKEYVDTALHSSQQLLTIVSDILDISKIESGSLVINHYHHDLIALIQQTLAQFKPMSMQKRLPIILDCDGLETLEVIADGLRITQIVTNLLSNGLKFTHDGFILVSVKVVDGRLSLSVQDTGIGITDEQQKKLFKPFSQADGSTTRQYGGTGLGLSISKRLAELMDGDIHLDSIPSKGSTFTLSLPLQVSEASLKPKCFRHVVAHISQDDRVANSLHHILAQCSDKVVIELSAMGLIDYVINHDDIDIVLIDHHDDKLVSELHAFSSAEIIVVGFAQLSEYYRVIEYPFSLHKLCEKTALPSVILFGEVQGFIEKEAVSKVLIVDDNEVNIKLLAIICESIGVQVATANYASKALDLMRNEHFDVIMTDLHMPNMDGIAFYNAIRQMKGYDAIPVIVTTADCSEEKHRHLISLGFYAVEMKPIQRQRIQQHFNELGLSVSKPIVNEIIATEISPITQWIEIERASHNLGGSIAIVEEMLATLMPTMPEYHSLIIDAYQAQDAYALERVLHKLKGGLVYCGLYALLEATESLQRHIKEKGFSNADMIYRQFDHAFEQSVKAYYQINKEG